VRARGSQERTEAVDRFERAGSASAAIDGVPAVAEAFQAAQVETLFLDAEASRDVEVWISSDPTQLAVDPDLLTGRPRLRRRVLRLLSGAGQIPAGYFLALDVGPNRNSTTSPSAIT